MNATQILGKIFGLFGVRPAGAASEVLHVSPDLLSSTLGHYQVHRNSYRMLIKVCVVQGLFLLTLLWICFWFVATAEPRDRFYVAAVDGRVQQIFPLDEALVSDQEMTVRVAQAITDALSFGARDYQINRGRNLKFFSTRALDALYSIPLGKDISAAQLDMDTSFKAEVDKTRPGGVVRNEVGNDFIRQWIIQVPLKVTKQNELTGEKGATSLWTVSVLARRSRDVAVRQGYQIDRVLGAAQVQPAPVQGGAAPAAASGAAVAPVQGNGG